MQKTRQRFFIYQQSAKCASACRKKGEYDMIKQSMGGGEDWNTIVQLP